MRLSATLTFGVKMTISRVISSIFSDLLPLHLSLNQRNHSLLVTFSFFSSSWRFVSSIGSIAPPWPLVRTFTKTPFIQRWPPALERSTVF